MQLCLKIFTKIGVDVKEMDRHYPESASVNSTWLPKAAAMEQADNLHVR